MRFLKNMRITIIGKYFRSCLSCHDSQITFVYPTLVTVTYGFVRNHKRHLSQLVPDW
jgi:hypothetical protein